MELAKIIIHLSVNNLHGSFHLVIFRSMNQDSRAKASEYNVFLSVLILYFGLGVLSVYFLRYPLVCYLKNLPVVADGVISITPVAFSMAGGYDLPACCGVYFLTTSSNTFIFSASSSITFAVPNMITLW